MYSPVQFSAFVRDTKNLRGGKVLSLSRGGGGGNRQRYATVHNLTGDTRKIFVSKTVDESHSARVLIGCKPIMHNAFLGVPLTGDTLTYVACHFSRAKRAPPKAEKGHTMKEIGHFRGTHILRPYYPIRPNMELID